MRKYEHGGYVITSPRMLTLSDMGKARRGELPGVTARKMTAAESLTKAKAGKAKFMIVFDQRGTAIGLVDPKNLMDVVDPPSTEKPAPSLAPVGNPAPPAEVGTPADSMAKSSAEAYGQHNLGASYDAIAASLASRDQWDLAVLDAVGKARSVNPAMSMPDALAFAKSKAADVLRSGGVPDDLRAIMASVVRTANDRRDAAAVTINKSRTTEFNRTGTSR